MTPVADVSKKLGCSEQYVRKLIRQKKLSAKKIGNTWVVLDDNFDGIEVKEISSGSKKTKDKISEIEIKANKLNVLSFFSGAMGLDIGLEEAGMNVLLACEIDEATRKTIVRNDDKIGLIGDLRKYSVEDILDHAGSIKKEQVDVIVGGPPCQAFSTAGRRMGFEDARGNVFLKFIDVITEIRPKYAVIENVRGLYSTPMALNIHDDVTENFPLDYAKAPGSSLYYICKKLEISGYKVTFNLYNSANFGVPQIRERVVIICTLLNDPVPFLSPTNSDEPSFGLPSWNTFADAVEGVPSGANEFIKFSDKRLRFIKMLTPGQNWRNLPPEVQEEAMGKAFWLGGGKTGFYRRLSWDRPSPTLVTHPAMPATELAHPEEDRPLSIQEYKKVQQFPDKWVIEGSLTDKYKQIGNAVPVGLGKAIGTAILNHYEGKQIHPLPNFPYSRYKGTDNEVWTKEFKRTALKQPVPELAMTI